MQVVLLTQTDVTSKIVAEAQVEELTEASVSLLELIFPRHVIEHMTKCGKQVFWVVLQQAQHAVLTCN